MVVALALGAYIDGMGKNSGGLGRLRIAAIYIDCPRPGCGGGIESRSNGSFMLVQDDLPDLREQPINTCGTCLAPIRVPARALQVLA
jgi:hypothetical protein